jgi:beta-phosphoglucomutase family hydrolase
MNIVTQRPPIVRLPASLTVCLFDLDGVLTRTREVHAAAWKEMFDAFLRMRAQTQVATFAPFDVERDYATYVDGKERIDGVRSFLHSRNIELPEGTPHDPPDADTVPGLAKRKDAIVLAKIEHEGVQVYEDAVQLVRAARLAGMRCAVVSSSAHCQDMLAAAGIEDLFDARVDALVAAHERLAGKPAPDMFIEAARLLAAGPSTAAVFEDSIAGVEAGQAGQFALVVGVDRIGQAEALRSHGADLVVSSLAELIRAA